MVVGSFNSIQVNSTKQFNVSDSIQFSPEQFISIQINSTQSSSVHFNSAWFGSAQFISKLSRMTNFSSIRFNAIQVNPIPSNSIQSKFVFNSMTLNSMQSMQLHSVQSPLTLINSIHYNPIQFISKSIRFKSHQFNEIAWSWPDPINQGWGELYETKTRNNLYVLITIHISRESYVRLHRNVLVYLGLSYYHLPPLSY